MAHDPKHQTSFDTPVLKALRQIYANLEDIKIGPDTSYRIGQVMGLIRLTIIDAEIDAAKQADTLR